MVSSQLNLADLWTENCPWFGAVTAEIDAVISSRHSEMMESNENWSRKAMPAKSRLFCCFAWLSVDKELYITEDLLESLAFSQLLHYGSQAQVCSDTGTELVEMVKGVLLHLWDLLPPPEAAAAVSEGLTQLWGVYRVLFPPLGSFYSLFRTKNWRVVANKNPGLTLLFLIALEMDLTNNHILLCTKWCANSSPALKSVLTTSNQPFFALRCLIITG